jgi:ABC-type polysaccharide/polyol phosphate export permease
VARRGDAVVDRPLSRTRFLIRLLPLWTAREIKAQFRQSAFDIGWALLTPVITVVGYGFVLTRAFGVDGDGIPYIVFAWAGVVMWTFAANAMMRGASSLVGSAELVRKVPFPKEVVPLANVAAAGLELVVGVVVLIALMIQQGVRPGATAVAAIPVMAAFVIWICGCAILFATVTTFVRDLQHGLAVLLRIGIFVTPVMYPASEVPARYRWALDTNPLAVFIDSLRACLLRGTWPDWTLLGWHSAAGLILLLAAVGYLRRVEGRLADVV